MSNKMIALVVTNLAGSGAEKVVLNLFNMFERYNVDVYIFLLENIVNYDLSETQKSRIIPLTENRKFHKLFSNIGDRILSNKLLNSIQKIEKKVNKKFDIVLSNLPAADRVCSFLDSKINVYYCIHTSYLQEIEEFKKNNKIKRALKKEKLYKKIYENRKLISVSDGIIKDIDKLGVNYKSIETIYNPFNFNEIIELGMQEHQIDKSNEYIICASAFRSVKRHDILLEAYKKSGIEKKLILLCKNFDKLSLLVKKLDLEDKVEILGFQKNPYPFIKNAKFLVLSSEREGLPTVLIESLILGTPVVSTNCVSGPDEILTDELAKYLAKVNDSDDLADKMKLLNSDEITITNNYIEKFSEENIVNKYLNLIKE